METMYEDHALFWPDSWNPQEVESWQHSIRARDAWVQQLANLTAKFTETKDFRIENDMALAMMHLGRASEAVAILRRLEAAHPGEYVIAANLGTAYELVGENSQAIKWISEAMRRDPQSHRGTEWLHIEILRKKMALPVVAEGRTSLFDFDWGSDTIPEVPRLLAIVHLDGLRDTETEIRFQSDTTGRSLSEAYTYQLGERLQFVAPPDPIVAMMLFDLANFHVLRNKLELAVPAYQAALVYGHPHSEIINKRIASFTDIIQRARANRPSEGAGVDGSDLSQLVSVLLLALGYIVGMRIFGLRRRRAHH